MSSPAPRVARAAGAGRHTRPLRELRRVDEPRYGGKSTCLGELLAAEIPVPPGFAIATSACEAFIDQAGLESTIARAVTGVGSDDVEATRVAADAIGGAMRSAPVPQSLRDEIAGAYADLAGLVGEADPPVAVRSSALGEDSQDATFAGQQETYLWVRGAEPVCAAVRDCWISLYSSTALSYRARLGHGQADAAMGVTVQLMVDSVCSGVMFTCNPLTGDRSVVAINAGWGLGLAVVGGEVTPDDHLVSKVTREVVRERVGSKDVEYVPDPAGHGTVQVEVPAERRTRRCLEEESFGPLVDVARRVERHFGAPQDIEWAIARDGEIPDSLFVLQSRPVTALPEPAKPERSGASAISLVMGTFGVDPAPEDR